MRTQLYGPDVKLFPFREALPKIKVAGENALAATSPALAIMDLDDVSLYELCQLISSVASSALRLVGHMDGFCVNNTTILLLSLMIGLVWLVVALESLLK
jgi:hypothetical protein